MSSFAPLTGCSMQEENAHPLGKDFFAFRFLCFLVLSSSFAILATIAATSLVDISPPRPCTLSLVANPRPSHASSVVQGLMDPTAMLYSTLHTYLF